MNRPTYTIQPQRQLRGSGWTLVPEHQAQRWAVLRLESWVSRGRTFHTTRTLTSHRTRVEAQAAVEALLATSRSKGKRALGALAKALAREPGDRAGPRPVGEPYARGLTEAEYRRRASQRKEDRP